jgi:hypothetical protein
VQHLDGFTPSVFVNEVVPLRDDVAQRTPLVAEGDAAVHAPGTLRAEFFIREGVVDLVPVENAQIHRPTLGHLAGELFESGGLAHST